MVHITDYITGTVCLYLFNVFLTDHGAGGGGLQTETTSLGEQ